MPLKTGKGSFDDNVAELIRAGHPRDQALAIAYKKQRECREDHERRSQEEQGGYGMRIARTEEVTQAQTKIGSTRQTANYDRTRLAAPGQFNRFFTKSEPGGKKVVIGVKKGGDTKAQAVLKPRKD